MIAIAGGASHIQRLVVTNRCEMRRGNEATGQGLDLDAGGIGLTGAVVDDLNGQRLAVDEEFAADYVEPAAAEVLGRALIDEAAEDVDPALTHDAEPFADAATVDVDLDVGVGIVVVVRADHAPDLATIEDVDLGVLIQIRKIADDIRRQVDHGGKVTRIALGLGGRDEATAQQQPHSPSSPGPD